MSEVTDEERERNTTIVSALLATAGRLAGRDDAGVFLLHAMIVAAIEDDVPVGELENHVRRAYQQAKLHREQARQQKSEGTVH